MENVKQTVVEAIVYFEEVIKETDETLDDCTPAIRDELLEQRKYYEAAYMALNLVHKIHMKQEQDRRERE